MAVGLDSAKEETEAYEHPYLDRGIATLVFDGPGRARASTISASAATMRSP